MRNKRGLVYGVGINDADYPVAPFINGKQKMCPFYQRWRAVLERCYSKKLHASQPTYAECTVAEEWLTFSNFKRWMETQNWEGNHLDKDIIKAGNKVYSPNTCSFVSVATNSLLTDAKRNRGSLPQGVAFHKDTGKLQASISIDGKQRSLGIFKTEEEAERAYRKEKRLYILRVACCEPDVRVKQGLYRHSELYR